MKQCGIAASAMGVSSVSAHAGVKLANDTLHSIIGRRRPNVIYIMADDMAYAEAGCYGQKLIETPAIDQIAAEGMSFSQHYSGNTVCAPSRCNLMTGLHPGHAFVRGNKPIDGYQIALPAGTKTIGHVFQENDYVTACMGKWGLGGPGTAGEPDRQGFDHFYGYLGQIQAHDYYHPDLWRYTHDAGWSNPPTNGVYSHDLITEDVLEFVQTYKDRPFFLYLAYCIPHADYEVPDLAQYENKPWTNTQKILAAMLSRMDRDIARLMDLIKKLGLDDDTIIMFTSDNGVSDAGLRDFFNSNDLPDGSGTLKNMKGFLHEGGIRVPLIARWPGKIKPGTTTDHISAFWDFFPTCCDLLGVKTPQVMWSDGTWHDTDGISYLPTLLGKDSLQGQHDYLYWELYDRWQASDNKRAQAVRQGKWKLVRHHLTKPQAQWVSELYDLDADVGETTNLAGSNPTKTAELEAVADSARICHSEFPLIPDQDTCY